MIVMSIWRCEYTNKSTDQSEINTNEEGANEASEKWMQRGFPYIWLVAFSPWPARKHSIRLRLFAYANCIVLFVVHLRRGMNMRFLKTAKP